jgi:hypothetical protein
VFGRLHPDLGICDRRFERTDPVFPLRLSVDLGRVARTMRGSRSLEIVENGKDPHPIGAAWLELEPKSGELRLGSQLPAGSFPNVPCLHLPRDVRFLDHLLRRLGVDELVAASPETHTALERLTAGQPYEFGIAARIVMSGSEATP